MSSSQQRSLEKAISLLANNKLSEAVDSLEQIVAVDPSQKQALSLLGQALAKLKQWDKAVPILEKVIVNEPNNASVHYSLALCLDNLKSYAPALDLYKRVLKLDIDYWQAYGRIADILLKDNQEVLALRYLEEALKIRGPDLGIYRALAEASKRIALSEQAFHYCNEAYKIKPDKELLEVMSFLLHYDPKKGLADFLELAQKYHEEFLAGLKPAFDHSKPIKLGSKIKLGFVSADCRNHPVANYLISVFEHINREEFEIHLYSNGEKFDAKTELMQELVDSFHSVRAMNDKALADLIYQEGINILFDMSGHTAGHRLGVFKLKPAPIQITHHGYFSTLAIPEIDYIIADATLIRPEEEKYFTEKIIRLNSYAHADLYGVPEAISEPPCIKNGYITFGGMNSVRKISKAVIETWVEIIKSVPGSKIRLDSIVLLSDMNRDYFLKQFEQAGLEKERVLIDSNLERIDYLLNFNDVDIALDTFPYGGGTSSLEAMMMGVPVLTIEGDRWVARMTSSPLKNIGHEELICNDRSEFISKAIELAGNSQRIADYRLKLPQALKNSALNITDFLADFELKLKEVYLNLAENQGACERSIDLADS